MATPTPNVIYLNGYEIDVTNFHKRHPGGSVIRFYEGLDATDAYNALHYRSKTADKMLNTLPKKLAPGHDDASDPLVKDFRELREELIKEGAFKPMYGMQAIRLLEVLCVHATALYLCFSGHWVLGGLMHGFMIGRNGLLMHEAGHRAMFGNMTLDKIAQLILFNFFVSASSSFWNNQHNKHHAATQELGHDTDLETLPVVAFNPETAKKGNIAALKLQWLYFLPAQLLLFFLWKFTHTRHAFRTRNVPEMACLIMHHVCEIALLHKQGVVAYLGYTALGYAFGGLYLASIFSLNHTHHDVVEKHTPRNWVRRSAEYTTNLTPSYFVTWVMGYLNFQIEHHLFPTLPHPRLPYVAPRIEALFKKHGMAYDLRTMPEAARAVYKVLVDAPRIAEKELAASKLN